MFDISALMAAIGLMTGSIDTWLWVIPGIAIGLFFGALPGVSITMAMALTLPISMYMDFLSAIIFLTSVYTGAGYGGSIPAVLINIPGTSAAVATTFDGYPMARKGMHNEALGAALGASVIGSIISYLVLLFLVVPIADLVIKIGPIEMFGIALWGMLMIGSLTGPSMLRGFVAGGLGVLLGTIGMNTVGFIRGTLDIPELLDGIGPIPALMGLLASSQLLGLVSANFIIDNKNARSLSATKIMAGFMAIFKYKVTMLRGTVIGMIIGAAPGVGASVSNLLSYSDAKRRSSTPEKFGKGDIEGVIAAESGNSSGEGGSMATTLSLGIPGGGATAVILAAFAMHNIVVGPSFIDKSKDLVYVLILNNIAQCLFLIPVGLIFIYFAGSIVKVPIRFLIPTVLIISVFGCFATDGNAAGAITLCIFSVIGWTMARYHYPPSAMVVGLLLGGMFETEAIKSMQLSAGNIFYFLERPGGVAIFALILLSTGYAVFDKFKKKATQSV